MKVNTQKLQKALAFVKSGIGNKPVLPILSDIHFFTDNGKLFVETTDLTCFYRSKVDDFDMFLDVMIPSAAVIGFVSKSSEEDIDLLLKSDDLVFKSGKNKLSTSFKPSTDFPKPQKLEFLEEVFTQEFFPALSKTDFYADDVVKGILCAINMKCEDNAVVFGSTDGYRLNVNSINKTIVGNKQFNLPGDQVIKIANLLKKGNSEKTNIYASETMIAFETDDSYVSTRLVEGKFPDYNKIIPKSFLNSFIINKSQLKEALKISENIIDKTTNIVNFNFRDQFLIITGSNINSDFESEIDYSGFQEDFEISFNETYLIQAINHIDSEMIVMKCNSGIQPVMLFDQDESENQKIMLMPIKP